MLLVPCNSPSQLEVLYWAKTMSKALQVGLCPIGKSQAGLSRITIYKIVHHFSHTYTYVWWCVWSGLIAQYWRNCNVVPQRRIVIANLTVLVQQVRLSRLRVKSSNHGDPRNFVSFSLETNFSCMSLLRSLKTLARPHSSSDRSFWLADDRVKACYECDVPFNLITRRHHCRLCGRIFCSTCTTNCVLEQGASPERVCNFCES